MPDAYHDRIWGEIYTINNDTLPYMNGEVQIQVSTSKEEI